MAVAGFYFTLLMIAMIPGKKKAPKKVEEHHHVPAAVGNEIPSFDSPDFSKWLETPGNIENALTKA